MAIDTNSWEALMRFQQSFLIVLLGTLGLAALPASAQVWIDANQLGGKLPDWVDARYLHPPPQAEPPTYQRVWVEPVYRTICKRIWHEPVYQSVCERIWVEGHSEVHTITTSH